MSLLDSYGFSREDFTETFKEMQFIIEKDSLLCDQFEKIDSKVKVSFVSFQFIFIAFLIFIFSFFLFLFSFLFSSLFSFLFLFLFSLLFLLSGFLYEIVQFNITLFAGTWTSISVLTARTLFSLFIFISL